MPCDTRRLPNQTITQRKEEIRDAVARLAKELASGNVKAIVSRQGAIAFSGWLEQDRGRVTDACAFRAIMRGDSQAAKLAIMRAEQLAGVPVNRQVLAHGWHSHDSGASWSRHGHDH
jgi:hypothetical protein